ncbi:MAG: hypothetical protein JWQ90_3009 [Hydrocarboniphaga sp.]|uniref:DUF6519 domain-containing protein n=1 Tax=Hydrocarboniphaga sp. TaxID=2033016 RepID=UPI00261A6653|nr:DUF6519 domain-containing protein [Hydrocarboniphaga sp.]MDB5970559.1 hypothetical protein [Hydrocarboniphaga sp.]
MSGDYSRYVYEPARDYGGVLLQQGRPLTDWDWNDLVAQINRRDQATRYDTFGGAAVVPLTTPDGFKLAVNGAQLTIGRGRIYVDGLLAENHGLPASAWDAALAELYGTQPIPYDQQPYLPNPLALPTSGGPHLVYVDVWQRELTQFEAPDLVDKALGVDTTTRLQTVWQVKVLANERNVSLACDTDADDIPGWSALTAPSVGRLSTATATYGSDNPCLIPPTGGYTGLENQLYRVEIHDGGEPGKATFKWSRDNASVETRVTRFVDAGTLLVESVGKDGVLRFSDGDWIEIVDDWLELNNLPGELHRVAVGGGVDDATRTITLEKPVSAGLFPVDAQGRPAAERHTRIRRWDQKSQVLRTDTAQPSLYFDLGSAASSGAIPVPADGTVTLALESGIVVSFDLFSAGGAFKSGDWWVFAARSTDASVELLDHAPPRGIHHHYAKLGLYTPGSQPTDCRQFWPPSFGHENCGCTICVSPQAHAQGAPSLQQAIDTVVARGGGTVCLEAGDYALRAPLRIEGAATLTLRGQGLATRLLTEAAAITIGKSADLTLERFSIVYRASEAAGFASIVADSVQGLRLRQLAIGPAEKAAGVAVALIGQLARVQVSDNLINAAFGLYSSVNASSPARSGSIAIDGLHVDGNVFQCARGAIDLLLDAKSGPPVCIRGNRIASSGHGIALTGNGLINASAEIAGNRIETIGNGIAANVFGLRVLDNDIRHVGSAAESTACGILIPQTAQNAKLAAGDCHLIGNRIAGFGGAAIRAASALGKAQVKQNQIAHCGAGIEVLEGGVESLSIENNQISGIEANPRDASQAQLVGIAVSAAQAVAIAGNTITGVGLAATSPNLMTVAVLVQGCDGIRISGNELSGIGPAAAFSGIVVGLLAKSPLGDVIVDSNRLRRDTGAHDADASAWFGVVIAGSQARTAAARSGSRAVATPPEVLQGFMVDAKPTAKARATAAAVGNTSLRVDFRGNQITARGGAFAVAILAYPLCDFSNNQCLRSSALESTLPDIYLAADTLLVAGNRVSGVGKKPSMTLFPQEDRYTVLGNITSSEILVRSAPLAAPWAPLNVQAP